MNSTPSSLRWASMPSRPTPSAVRRGSSTSTPTAPELLGQLRRRTPARSLSGEVSFARSRGAEVLMVRPTAAELRIHGRNLMRPDSTERVARAAYEATTELIGTDRFQRTLDQLAA